MVVPLAYFICLDKYHKYHKNAKKFEHNQQIMEQAR